MNGLCKDCAGILILDLSLLVLSIAMAMIGMGL